MSMTTTSPPAAEARFAAPEQLTVAHVAAVYAELGALFDAAASIEMDLARMQRIDAAGVQLLLAADRRAADRGITMRWKDPDHRLADAIATLGLGSAFATYEDASSVGTPSSQHGDG